VAILIYPMTKKPDRTPAPVSSPGLPELPERWSVPRKQAVVVRLPRSEALDQVSRETQGPARELETGQRRFLDGGRRGLRTRGDPEERELALAKARLGEVRWLGMTISPSYVGEPERNGVIERFLRTLKEQCL
jgi:hypothetical protein